MPAIFELPRSRSVKFPQPASPTGSFRALSTWQSAWWSRCISYSSASRWEPTFSSGPWCISCSRGREDHHRMEDRPFAIRSVVRFALSVVIGSPSREYPSCRGDDNGVAQDLCRWWPEGGGNRFSNWVTSRIARRRDRVVSGIPCLKLGPACPDCEAQRHEAVMEELSTRGEQRAEQG